LHQDPKKPKPRFTGIFIPVEILEYEDLSLTEKLLLSWIDALYDEEKGGCFASNEYLADRMGIKPNTISKSLVKLRKLNLIEDISFDGRERVIRALIGKFVDKNQHSPKKSKSDLDKNPSRVGKKSNPEMEKNPSTPIYERKEERKDIKPPTPLKGDIPETGSPPVGPLKFGKFVSLSKEEFQELQKFCGGTDPLSEIIQEINDYLSSTGKKPYKDYAATIRNWFRRRKASSPVNSFANKPKENPANANPVSKDMPRRANEHVF
jgi:hypothetical protein